MCTILLKIMYRRQNLCVYKKIILFMWNTHCLFEISCVYMHLISEEGLSQLDKSDSGRTSRYWSTFWPLPLSQLYLSIIISYFTLSPEEINQALWYAQVYELLTNMVDKDDCKQDIEDADHSVCCCLLLLGLASISTVIEEWPQYKYYHVHIQCSLMKIQ